MLIRILGRAENKYKKLAKLLVAQGLICILTDETVLIKIESIISKCIILQNDDEYFISFYYDETMG